MPGGSAHDAVSTDKCYQRVCGPDISDGVALVPRLGGWLMVLPSPLADGRGGLRK